MRASLWAVFSLVVFGSAPVSYGADATRDTCDPGTRLTDQEQSHLMQQMRISTAAQKLLSSFFAKPQRKLILLWNTASYSQIQGSQVCIHLSKNLPTLEHVADLVHELVHATRLPAQALLAVRLSKEAFIHARLAGPGGEADAFATECVVKVELTQTWDALCAPYARPTRIKSGRELAAVPKAASSSTPVSIDFDKIVRDLYSGELAASLTGETYPVLLARQYSRLENRPEIQ